MTRCCAPSSATSCGGPCWPSPTRTCWSAPASSTPSGFAAFDGLDDIVPRPGHKASGEERAWGRRLAKRFGAEGRVNDRTFVITGTGDAPPALDHECIDPSGLDPEVVAFFANLDRPRGDALIAFGWAMAEYLAARASK